MKNMSADHERLWQVAVTARDELRRLAANIEDAGNHPARRQEVLSEALRVTREQANLLRWAIKVSDVRLRPRAVNPAAEVPWN